MKKHIRFSKNQRRKYKNVEQLKIKIYFVKKQIKNKVNNCLIKSYMYIWLYRRLKQYNEDNFRF